MKIYNRNHLYRYIPNYLDNRKLPAAEQVVVRLRGISAAENDAYQRDCLAAAREFSQETATQKNEARFNKLVAEKFDGVEGLEIDGVNGNVLDFETFYAEAPQVMVNEIIRVIMSSELLTLGEQKNFVPESGSHLLAPAAA